MSDCPECGFEHRTQGEGDAIHEATRSIHRWLRLKLRAALKEIPVPVLKKVPPANSPVIGGEKKKKAKPAAWSAGKGKS